MLVLALASLALAGEEPRATELQITFKTDPPGARVFVNQQYVGLSGQPIPVEVYPDSQLMLSFELDGFNTRTAETLSGSLLSSADKTYPLDGSVLELQPAGPVGYVRKYPAGVAVAVLLGVVAAVLLRRQSRQLRRARQVEEWIARAPEDASRVSRTLGGFLLVDTLGGGGMAQVYRGIPADSLDPSRAVAVKLLHRTLAGDPELAARFEREIEVCRKLDHPNVVRTLNWGIQDDGRTYLLMELVDGGTLRSRVKAGGLSVAEAESLLEPIFAALLYAHERGIVHRDLKPENILLTARGVPKISDFGLARAGDSETLTATGTALGTPAYMAPEQVGGTAGPAADQYALGILTYELLTGRKPFENPDTVQLIFMHISENPQSPSALRPAIPPELDEAILRMLAKEPESRFPDLTAAWSALRQGLRAMAS